MQKIFQKFAIWVPSHKFVGLYLCNWDMYRQSKKIVKQQYLLQMFSQYGELRPTSSWDRSGSLRHPCWFQWWGSRPGSVTARYSSSRRQPNFAALNRERHLYSAVRPSRWAFAHISSLLRLLPVFIIKCVSKKM